MLTLSGAPAVSEFRLAKLLAALRERVTHVTGLDARYLHFVDVEREPTAEERDVLESLLRYGPAAPDARPDGETLLVVPRFGTVSPWSSKATDIAHVCGLAAVRRIERGVAWYVASARAASPTRTGPAIGALLHDRMTESVLRDAAGAAALFSHAAPQPLRTVPLLADGAAGARGGQRRARPRAVRRRDRLPRHGVPRARARPDRRRADDVRAGQLRALPAQDLQRRLDRGRRAQRASRCSA